MPFRGHIALALEGEGWRALERRLTERGFAAGPAGQRDDPAKPRPDLIVTDVPARCAALPPLSAFGEIVRLPLCGAAADLHDLAHAVRRIESAARLRLLAEEAERRRRLIAATGRSPWYDLDRETSSEGPPTVLIAGEAGPDFLEAERSARAAGCAVVGALTAAQAEDYLAARGFDAVVLLAGPGAGAEALLAHLARLPRLFHCAVALAATADRLEELPEELVDRAAEVLLRPLPEAFGQRLRDLARRTRRLAEVKRQFADLGFLDTDGDGAPMMAPPLFQRHLERQLLDAERDDRHLALAVLKFEGPETQAADAAAVQAACLAAQLVRQEDVAARLTPRELALALPATDARGAAALLTRVSGVVRASLFDAGGSADGLSLDVQPGFAARRPGETAASLLDRALGMVREPLLRHAWPGT